MSPLSRRLVLLVGCALTGTGVVAAVGFGYQNTICFSPQGSCATFDPGAGGPGLVLAGTGVGTLALGLLWRISLTRTRALLLSLALTVALNMTAGILTLIFANGTTIVETNPASNALLQELGPATLFVRAAEIALLYPLAYLVSKAIASGRPILNAKRIYLFTFALLLAVLPAGALADLLSDVMVVLWAFDGLAGPQRIVLIALGFAVPFAAIQAGRKWTLQERE